MKVSCIITCRNDAIRLETAIESVEKQSYPIDKIIIVDDYSDTIITSKHDVIRNLKNEWVYKSRNIGALQLGSDTDAVFFLDSDDYVSPEYIKHAVRIMEEEKALVVYPNQIQVRDGHVNSGLITIPKHEKKLLKRGNYISYCALIDFKTFKALGGYDEVLNDTRNHLAEWKLWRQIDELGKIVYCGSDVDMIFYYRISDTQMSKRYERTRRDMELQMFCSLNDSDSIKRLKDFGNIDILYITYIKSFCKKTYKDLSAYGTVATVFIDAHNDFNHILAIIKITFNVKCVLSTITGFDNIFKPEQTFLSIPQMRTAIYYAKNGPELRLNYPELYNNNDIQMIDLGGYHGDWTKLMCERYNNDNRQILVHFFEPLQDPTFKTSTKCIINKIRAVATTKDGQVRMVESKDASHISDYGKEVDSIDFIRWMKYECHGDVDILKMNIEGSEYDILEKLIENNLISRFKNIQVQFHQQGVHNARERMTRIQDELRKTHHITWHFDFVFENWKRINYV